MNSPVSIIIPTFNNPQYLQPCLLSLLQNRPSENIYHIYVINNGHPESCDWINLPHVTVLQTGGKNLGWEGGLKFGLEQIDTPFVCFLNDDTYIPHSSRLWMNKLLYHFSNPIVGAVGPSSNVVMGHQNIFSPIRATHINAKFLIGFCMVLRREALEKAGGIDDTLPGGDDFDLSIRLRDAGYALVADRDVFVYHHGFKTGERVFGTADKTGGWNSYEFKEKVDHALIQKHGFKKWYEVIKSASEMPKIQDREWRDIEAEMIREHIVGDVILDLGCGGSKTLEHAIGVDMIKKDEYIDTLNTTSSADVEADVSQPLPFEENSVDTIIARHILEHMVDPFTVIEQWRNVLKYDGGTLIIAVPNEANISSIVMNIEHKHAWTPESMKVMLEKLGFVVEQQLDPNNGVSFITVAKKI